MRVLVCVLCVCVSVCVCAYACMCFQGMRVLRYEPSFFYTSICIHVFIFCRYRRTRIHIYSQALPLRQTSLGLGQHMHVNQIMHTYIDAYIEKERAWSYVHAHITYIRTYIHRVRREKLNTLKFFLCQCTRCVGRFDATRDIPCPACSHSQTGM